MFYLLQCHQTNSSGHDLPHKAWNKLDVLQIFVELTCQNFSYSQGNSKGSGNIYVGITILGATTTLTESEKLENNE